MLKVLTMFTDEFRPWHFMDALIYYEKLSKTVHKNGDFKQPRIESWNPFDGS